ncbi:hypothetical protein I8D64_09185 [Brachybacterium sp. MASK1Z-5]|uniref:Uncharacterized protein n=1 Tax=Brachybacterium halotolerans TaxID=2795215 RepID=A0ABS1BA93_9MICO|nr:hypothetical protein [Brachybacterium halotolerans]MBK0331576.1 hypothetical protein [Brachybacterium halotolerans]
MSGLGNGAADASGNGQSQYGSQPTAPDGSRYAPGVPGPEDPEMQERARRASSTSPYGIWDLFLVPWSAIAWVGCGIWWLVKLPFRVLSIFD